MYNIHDGTVELLNRIDSTKTFGSFLCELDQVLDRYTKLSLSNKMADDVKIEALGNRMTDLLEKLMKYRIIHNEAE